MLPVGNPWGKAERGPEQTSAPASPGTAIIGIQLALHLVDNAANHCLLDGHFAQTLAAGDQTHALAHHPVRVLARLRHQRNLFGILDETHRCQAGLPLPLNRTEGSAVA